MFRTGGTGGRGRPAAGSVLRARVRAALRLTVAGALVAGFGLPLAARATTPAPAAGHSASSRTGSSSKAPPLAADISAAQVELAKLDDQLDVADENYRGGQIALAQAKSNQAAADRSLASGKARRVALQQRVDEIASVAYETGAIPRS